MLLDAGISMGRRDRVSRELSHPASVGRAVETGSQRAMGWNDDMAERVDAAFVQEVRSVVLLNARVLFLLGTARETGGSELARDLLALLDNTLRTIETARNLWRRGLLLQAGILLRSAIEGLATVVALWSNRDLHVRYRQGRFESTHAVGIARQLLPQMGEYLATLYGIFSEHFTHMGRPYRGLLIATPEVNDDDGVRLRGFLVLLKGAYLLTDAVSEFTFFDFCTDPVYWKRQENGELIYASVPGDEAIQRHFGEEIRIWEEAASK